MSTQNYQQLPAPPNTGGVKMSTFEGAVGGVTVESASVTLTDPDTLTNGAKVLPLSVTAMSAGTNGLVVQAAGQVYNGTGFDAQTSGSAANLVTKQSVGAAMVALPGQWSVNHTPATATQATASQAAAGAGKRNVCATISATFATAGTAQTSAVQVNLRDDVTGAGTILWSKQVILPTNGLWEVGLSGLNIPGTANKAMTLEFSGAGVTASLQSVSMTGYIAI